MNRLLRWKKKIWTNSASSHINLLKFTLKKFSDINPKRISLKSKKNINYKRRILFEKRLYRFETENKKECGSQNFRIGSVLVLLSSKFQGKKVILVNVTKKGLLVISGPYKLNGISLRRVNPKYVLPTQFQLNIEREKTTTLSDNYFKILKQSKKSKDDIFRNKVKLAHNLRQTFIDRFLMKEITKNLFLNAYLRTKYIRPF